MPKTILITLAFILVWAAYSSNVDVSCASDDTCTQGFSYNFKGADSTSKKCTSECAFTQTITINVAICSHDFRYNQCPNNVCINFFNQSSYCISSTQQCSSISSPLTCGFCNYAQCPTGQCLAFNNQEYCLWDSYCFKESMFIQQQQCSLDKDSLGNQCECCWNIDFSQTNLGVCSSQAAFDGTELRTFATYTKSYEKISAIKLLFLIGLLFIVMI